MIKFLLMSLLARGSRHGYELKAQFEELFGGTWALNAGQVYMTLSKLEADGLVSSEVVPQELLPDRRMYSLTSDGRQELKRWTSEASEGPVRLRDELFAKVLAALVAGDRSPLDLIWAQRQAHLKALAQLTKSRSDPSLHPTTVLVLQGAILRTEADLKWLDLCEEYVREGSEG